jgi:hypothetical protein
MARRLLLSSAMSIKVWLALVFFLCIWVSFADAQPVTYGELMVRDQLEDTAGPHSLSVSAGYDVTNPYLNTYSGALTYSYDLNSAFALDLEGVGFSADESRYNRRLESELSVFGISADEDRPSYAAFAAGQLKLLQGRVNLLGLKALPFRFSLRAGSGYIWNSDNVRASAGTWGISSKIFFSPHWGAALRFDQDIEEIWAPAENIYRNRLAGALTYVF